MTRVAGPTDADTERLSEAFDRFIDALRSARGRVPVGSDHHLTLAQLHLAGVVDAHPGMTVRELARAAGVTQPTVTPALDGLQRHDLIKREADPHDRRCVLVDLTDSGRELLHAERARLVPHRHELLGQLSPEDRPRAGAILHPLPH